MEKTRLISIVVPCYNEEAVIPLFVAELARVIESTSVSAYAWELVLVDDGSTDGTLRVFKDIKESFEAFDIRYLSFSRNFGKEAALFAGMEVAKGEWVAVMDADLQDPPALLPKMCALLEEGSCDCVAARRVSRQGEPAIRSLGARLFYKLIRKMSNVHIVDGARDFRLMNRQMVDAVLSLPERCRFSKGIFSWVGFKTEWVEFQKAERAAGETRWSLPGLFLYSIEGIVGFSTAPLHFASVIGLVLFLLAVFFGIVIVCKTLIFGDPVSGWPSLACIILAVGGIQLLCLGVFGEYLSKTYLEVKGRPLYLIREQSL